MSAVYLYLIRYQMFVQYLQCYKHKPDNRQSACSRNGVNYSAVPLIYFSLLVCFRLVNAYLDIILTTPYAKHWKIVR